MVVELTNLSSRPLVQWIKSANPYVVESLRSDGPIGAIGISAVDAAQLDASIASAGERGFGVVIDTEPYRVQLEPGHPYRSKTYRGVGLEWLEGRFDASTMRLASADRAELAALHRDVQAIAGATMFLWSGHCVPDTAPLAAGRRQELEIARDFLDIARASGATHPAPRSGAPRSAAIGLSVDARYLSQRVSGELAAAYSELDPNLFWISCWNFTGSAAQYGEVRYLARLLQRKSGIPCLTAGLGALWEGALRNQIASVCQGWGRGKLEFPPAQLPAPPPGEEQGTPYGIAAFHPAIRGAIQPGERYRQAAEALYARYPCPCGHHDPMLPPEGQRASHLHNLYWAEFLAEAAIAAEPSQATAGLGPPVAAAEALREELELGQLSRAWKKATVDPSDGRRIAVPSELWLPRAKALH